jgi:hypothetical protein
MVKDYKLAVDQRSVDRQLVPAECLFDQDNVIKAEQYSLQAHLQSGIALIPH